MPAHLKTFVPLSLLALVASTGAAVALTQPGGAAVPELTYTANAEARAWHLSQFDQDMSGDPATIDLTVGRAVGAVGSALSPRSSAVAANLGGTPAPSGLQEAPSEATSTGEPAGSTTKSATAGSVPNTVNYATATLTSRSRWAGDDQCVATGTPITTSTTLSNGASTAPAAIPAGTPDPFPIPLPIPLPTDIPTSLPSGFPTDQPTNLPSPTLPTTLPTLPLPTDSLPTLPLPTDSLTLPTDITSILPPLPSITLPGLPRSATQPTADGAVSMATLAATKLDETTGIQDFGTVGDKKVVSQATGSVVSSSSPAMTFFGGEVSLNVTSPAKLVAYSTGTANGSQVDWTPPSMTLSAGGSPVVVPTDGSALTVNYAENSAIKLIVAAGHLNSAESADGTLAQGAVNTLNFVIKNGDKTVLEGAFMPLAVKATSPAGGVKCPTVVPKRDAKLKLSGKSNGAKADVLKVTAIKKARHARVTVYTQSHHKLHRVGKAKLDRRGHHTFKLKDKNRGKATVYVVKLKATAATLPDHAKRKLK